MIVNSRPTANVARRHDVHWQSKVWAIVAFGAVFALLSQLIAPAVNAQTPASGSTASLADAVPATSVLFMEANLDQSSAQWTKAYELLERSGINNLSEQTTGASTQDLGAQAEEMQFNGKAAVVFSSADGLAMSGDISTLTNEAADVTTDPTAMANGGVPEGFALIVAPSNPDALAAEFVDTVNSEAESNSATVETEDYNGVTITYWTSTDPEVAATATATVDGRVLLGVNPDDLKPVIDTVQGKTPALSSDENYQKAVGALNQDNIVTGFLNSKAIFDAMPAESKAMMAELPESAQTQAGYSAWAMYADDAGFRMDTVSFAADGSEMKAPESFSPSMASKVGDQNLFFMNGNNLASLGLSDLLGFGLQQSMSEMNSDGTSTPAATPSIDETYAQLEQSLG